MTDQLNLVRRPTAITDESFERDFLNSTPKGEVDGRLFTIDLSELEFADFETVGRLLGYIEGFLRRGGTVQIIPPPTRPTVEEGRILSRQLGPRSKPGLVLSHERTAQRVQARSRVARFLERVRFFECVRCVHLDPAGALAIDVGPKLVAEDAAASRRVELPARSVSEPIVELVPFEWLDVSDEESTAASAARADQALTALGLDRPTRSAVTEFVHNVRQHSHAGEPRVGASGPAHALLGAVLRESDFAREYEVLVVDGGVGIPQTLSEAFEKEHGEGSNSAIVRYAFEDRSTRKSQVRGTARGLGYARKLVENRGLIEARSDTGRAVVGVAAHDGVNVADAMGFQPGTAVRLKVPAAAMGIPPRERSDGVKDVRSEPISLHGFTLDDGGLVNDIGLIGRTGAVGAQDVVLCMVDSRCPRPQLEEFLTSPPMDSALVLLAAADGQNALLLAEAQALVSARGGLDLLHLVALDEMTPHCVYGALDGDTTQQLLTRVLDRVNEHLASEIEALVADLGVQSPRRTWSLEVVGRWIDHAPLMKGVAMNALGPMAMAYMAVGQLARTETLDDEGLAVLDVLVTESAMLDLGRAVATWLGAEHVRLIANPQEPDAALLADELNVASVVLAPVVQGGGSTAPILRGLMSAGRSCMSVVAVVDGRVDAGPVNLAGLQVEVGSLIRQQLAAAQEVRNAFEADAVARLRAAIDGEDLDSEFHEAVAATPSALRLGHFHSANRGWMSTVISPPAIADSQVPLGALVLSRLEARVRRLLVEEFSEVPSVTVKSMNQPNRLAGRLDEVLRAGTSPATTNRTVVLLVDWGALTGETAVTAALNEASSGPDMVISAVGVDRASDGPQRLLSSASIRVDAPQPGRLGVEDVDRVSTTVRLEFVSAVDFPRDYRAGVDCPLCATERSLVAMAASAPADANRRIRLLRVRTSDEPPSVETRDAFGCPMSADEVRTFLTWRAVLHLGFRDQRVAHGVAVRAESDTERLSAAELMAIARVLVLNPDLLRRRPWSSPRFRHALAGSLERFLLTNRSSSISSDMARQMITAMRMCSKSSLVRSSGRLYERWKPAGIREEIVVALASMLKGRVSTELQTQLATALQEIRASSGEAAPPIVGYFERELVRQQYRAQTATSRAGRWSEARKMLVSLTQHVDVGLALEKLRIIAQKIGEPRRVAGRQQLLAEMEAGVERVRRFVSEQYPRVVALIEPEAPSLVESQLMDVLPNQELWLSRTDALLGVLRSWHESGDAATPEIVDEVVGLVAEVVSPLEYTPGARTFAALILSSRVRLADLVENVSGQSDPGLIVRVEPHGMRADVFFPGHLLSDLLWHLIQNAQKHVDREADSPPQVSFRLKPRVAMGELHRLRVGYKGTISIGPPNVAGGLSRAQWGGVSEMFGGALEVVEVENGESFAVLVSLAGWME